MMWKLQWQACSLFFSSRVMTPGRHRVLLQVLLRDQVLALPGLSEDDRLRSPPPSLDPAGEPARHPHQVRVIELVVAAVQPRNQHRNPPGLCPIGKKAFSTTRSTQS
jgi:hypothetical protein